MFHLNLILLLLLVNYPSMSYQEQNVNDLVLKKVASYTTETDKFLKKYIPKISFRLVKKNWIVPNHQDEQVYDEYPGTMNDALHEMMEGKYPFQERKIENCEELFTLRNEKGELEYNRNLPSIFIVPGLHGNADSPLVRATVIAMRLRNLHKRYNLFAVEMREIDPVLRFAIFKELFGYDPRYEEIAELISIILIKGIEQGYMRPADIHLVGMSVSANLVGYMARHIYMVYNKKVGSVLCLDPISNERNKNYIHISQDDATVVHVYHTCSWVSGTRERLGTADFVFNGGYKQPECKKKLEHPPFTYSPFRCSHRKVGPRFWYVILFPSRFKARKCGTWNRFRNCFCEDNEEVTMSYPIEKNPARGIYQLQTAAAKPYGLGEEGSHCFSMNKKWLEARREIYVNRAKTYRITPDKSSIKP